MGTAQPQERLGIREVNIGDLVKYNNRYTTEDLIGIIYFIDYYFDPDCPYKVRWQHHTDSMRCYYTREELQVI